MTQEQLEHFFKDYERFFMQSLGGTVDSEAVASFYAPAFIAASPLGVMGGENNDAFRQGLAAGYDQYRQIGTTGMRVRSVTKTPIDDLHAVASVGWTASYARADGTPLDIDFDVHYLMQEHAGALHIFGWISGDEQEVYKEHGLI